MNAKSTAAPTCPTCQTELVEMWKGTEQIMVCPEPHAVERRTRYVKLGYMMQDGPKPLHRMFDRCRYDGPSTLWEDDVTCLRCRGWQKANPEYDNNTRIEIDMLSRLRRNAIVCAVDGGRKTKGQDRITHTLCGKPLEKARQRIARYGSKSGEFSLVTCQKCWDQRPDFIRIAEKKLLNL